MEFRQLYYVTEIAKYRSFTKAAEALYITQPNISKQVKLLEDELGITIFIRNPHKVELTEDGERFCMRAQQILNDLDQLMKEFHHQTTQQKAILNIAVFPAFQKSVSAKWLQTFYRDHVNVLGTIRMTDNYTAYEGLQDESFDFAIIKVRPEKQEPEFEYIPLLEEQMLGLVRRENRAVKKGKLTAKDLAKTPLFTGEEGTHLFQDAKDIYDERQIPFNVAYQNTFNYELNINFISSIDGVMFLTESTAKALDDSDTVALPLEPAVPYNTYLVYSKEREFHGIYKSFIQFMQDAKNTL